MRSPHATQRIAVRSTARVGPIARLLEKRTDHGSAVCGSQPGVARVPDPGQQGLGTRYAIDIKPIRSRHYEVKMSYTGHGASPTFTFVLVLLAASGCSDTSGESSDGADGAGADGSSATSGSGAGTSTGGAGTSSGGSGTSSGGSGTSSGGSGTSSGGSGTSSGDSGTSSGGASAGDAGDAMSCQGDPFSGPELRDCNLPGGCGDCLAEKACARFLFQCAHDAGCVCMAECVGNNGVTDIPGCQSSCSLTAIPPGFPEWVRGATAECWDEGCDRPAAPLPAPTDTTTGGSIASGTDADCAFDSSLQYDVCSEVLQLQTADGNVCARIERRNDGAGPDANTSWTLLDVRVGPLGEVCHTDDPGSLCWFASHHNHADWAHVTCGNRHYDIDIGFNCGDKLPPDPPPIQLHVFEEAPASGTCAPSAAGICRVGAPIDLFPVP